MRRLLPRQKIDCYSTRRAVNPSRHFQRAFVGYRLSAYRFVVVKVSRIT